MCTVGMAGCIRAFTCDTAPRVCPSVLITYRWLSVEDCCVIGRYIWLLVVNYYDNYGSSNNNLSHHFLRRMLKKGSVETTTQLKSSSWSKHCSIVVNCATHIACGMFT